MKRQRSLGLQHSGSESKSRILNSGNLIVWDVEDERVGEHGGKGGEVVLDFNLEVNSILTGWTTGSLSSCLRGYFLGRPRFFFTTSSSGCFPFLASSPLSVCEKTDRSAFKLSFWEASWLSAASNVSSSLWPSISAGHVLAASLSKSGRFFKMSMNLRWRQLGAFFLFCQLALARMQHLLGQGSPTNSGPYTKRRRKRN